jgi:hypothetical protein
MELRGGMEREKGFSLFLSDIITVVQRLQYNGAKNCF